MVLSRNKASSPHPIQVDVFAHKPQAIAIFVPRHASHFERSCSELMEARLGMANVPSLDELVVTTRKDKRELATIWCDSAEDRIR